MLTVPSAKKSSNVLLIGDHGGHKADFLLFLHAILTGASANEFAEMGSTLPDDTKASDASYSYTITCAVEGTKINILDTNELDTSENEKAMQSIENALKKLKTVDTIIVVADRSNKTLGSNVLPLLEMCSRIFPRSIHKNICFVFTCTDGGRGEAMGYEQQDLPYWCASSQTFGPILNMVELRTLLLNKTGGTTPSAKMRSEYSEFSEFSKSYDNSTDIVFSLLDFINGCVVQSRDMSHLYRQAAYIERALFNALYLGDRNSTVSNENAPSVSRLVKEYCLIAASPDFLTHLEIVLELLGSHHDAGNLRNSVDLLVDLRSTLQILEGDDALKFPKCFIIS